MAMVKWLAALACLVGFCGLVQAELPEYRQMRNQNEAGGWLYQQYKRAEEFERRGEQQKAQKIREYADQRVRLNRELGEGVRDNWPGNK